LLLICRDKEEDEEWIHKTPILDKHYAKLIEEYGKENDLINEEKMMKLKVLSEFPDYWPIFNWNSILFLLYTVYFLAPLTEGLYYIGFLIFCLVYN